MQRFLSILAAIFLSSQALAEGEPPGAEFELARRDLRLGNFEEAARAFRSLEKTPALAQWSRVYLAETQIERGEFESASEMLGKVSRESAASVLAEALKVEASIRSGKSPSTGSFPSTFDRVLPQATLEYVKLLSESNTGRSGLTRYQQFRARYPKTTEARRALQIQREKFGEDLELWSDAKTVIDEINILLRQGLPEDAFNLGMDFIQHQKLPNSTEQREQLFTLLLKIRPSLQPAESQLGDAERQDLAVSRAFVTAREAWNNNHYSEALEALTALPETDPDRIYLEARIEEERHNYQSSIVKYQQFLAAGANSNRIEGARRLFFLLLLTNQQPEAKKVADQILPEIQNDDELRDSLVYWKGGRKELTERSYYYFVSHGYRPETPSTEGRTKALPDKKECKIAPMALSQKAKAQLLKLKELGLFDLLTLEFRYQAQSEEGTPKQNYSKDDSISVLSRAKTLSEYGAVQGAISELSSSPAAQRELYSKCPLDVERILFPLRYIEPAQARAAQLNLPLPLLLAVMRTESAFNPLAVSSAKAKGLMQMIEPTAKEEGWVKAYGSLFDPRVNIFYGSKHLLNLIKNYDGRWDLAIAAYNAGRTAVERWQTRYPDVDPALFVELIPFDETRRYVKRVLSAYWTYSERLRAH